MPPAEDDSCIRARRIMVDSQLRSRGITDRRVLDAMGQVPRQEFVGAAYALQAYEDHPLPIGEEQTISQPFVVALMLELLQPAPSDISLEIGTGSGYVTALLAQLTRQVYSIERHELLARQAETRLHHFGYQNAEVRIGDGIAGLPERAPYDVIMVSAAASQIPPALVSQLAENGRLVVPVGTPETQELHLIRKRDGKPEIEIFGACRFVPLVGG
ncbi:MAG: protein-L-isoaspartate(D-aspartate) O-methyltransferase [Acidobacteriales bacterium]|nr:protein-L-isoaspartate(D-aspartate) O-methyltransferase [Terriglobales bacterium]